jgi:hypothetical protein
MRGQETQSLLDEPREVGNNVAHVTARKARYYSPNSWSGSQESGCDFCSCECPWNRYYGASQVFVIGTNIGALQGSDTNKQYVMLGVSQNVGGSEYRSIFLVDLSYMKYGYFQIEDDFTLTNGDFRYQEIPGEGKVTLDSPKDFAPYLTTHELGKSLLLRFDSSESQTKALLSRLLEAPSANHAVYADADNLPSPATESIV